MRRETAIQQNDGVDRLPLELCPVKNLYYVYQGARSFVNMPGNAALCELIDRQSEHPSMNGATSYKHLYIIFYTEVFKKILHPINRLLYLLETFLITPATETFIYKLCSYHYNHQSS